MNPPQPWDRLDTEGEGSRAYLAFCLYRDLASDRSLYKAGQEYSRLRAKRGRSVGAKPHGNLERWSVKYDWVRRARAWDDHLLAAARSSREEVILAELQELKVDQLALANDRIRLELRGHKSTERFFDALEQKFRELVKLPSTDIRRQKLNEAGDVIEVQELDGLKPTELARVVKQAMDTLAQGVNGNKKISQVERIETEKATAPTDPTAAPMVIDLAFSSWPSEEEDRPVKGNSDEPN